MNSTERALHHLFHKLLSEQELKNILYIEFKCSDNYVEKIENSLIDLKKHGIINDLSLAHHIAIANEHKGNNFISSLLQRRLIDKELIDQVIRSLRAESKRGAVEAKQRLLSLNYLSLDEKKLTLARFLKGRQFSVTTINLVLEQLDNIIHMTPRKKDLLYKIAS